MKIGKRLTALVLAMALLMTLAAPGAWITTAHATEIDLGDLEISQTNPLYGGNGSAIDPIGSSAAALYSIGAASPKLNDEYWNLYGAAEEVRGYLEARETVFSVNAYLEYTSQETMEDELVQMIYDIIALAMVHTGVPTEGDYIQWQWSTWGLSNYALSSDNECIYATLEFTFEYYTTPSQEQAVTDKVHQLLAEWNVYTADSYTKLKTIYDYICANVTYDHANLNDDSYDLKYTAYAALMNGTAVCQGYALLLYRLALELGVDARLIAGDTNGDGEADHGWNIASVSDLYYNLDSTWDAGETNYRYFLVSPANFTDHVRSEEYDTAAFHEVYPMGNANYVPDCVHDYVETVTEATCTEDGSATYTCSVCGNTYTEVIPAAGHTYTDVVTKPTCTEDGYTTHTCSVCGDTYTDSTVSKLGHNFNEGTVTKEPTCAATGVMTYTCSTCGKTLQETIPMVDHVYDNGAVTKTPTCSALGVMTYTCTGCGHTYTEEIPMTSHVYNDGVVTAPTCTEMGYTTYTCVGCGTSYQDYFVNATGHSYDDGVVTREPTCTLTGITTYTCYSCGKTIEDTSAALGHTYSEGVVTTAPTCTLTGVMTFTCVHGDDSYTEVIPANGHSWDEGTVIKDSTCTETGEKSHICTVCGDATIMEIPMKEHTYEGGICTVCGQVQLGTPSIKSCYSTKQDSVKITWNLAENADGYYLWRSTNPEDHTSWKKVKTITSGTTDRYTNQQLTIGVTYYYAVQAYVETASGEIVTSEFSNVDYMPAAVVFDGPYSNSTSRIRILWNEVSGAHGYQIWGLQADGSWKIVKTIGDRGNVLTEDKGATTAYSNTGLVSGNTYTYKMRAFMIKEDGRKVYGTYSDEYSVAVKPEATTITVTSPKTGRALISWEAVNGAAGYQIWMADAKDGTYKIIKTAAGDATSYTKYDLESGKTYYFKVRAYAEAQDRKAFSAYTDITSVTVK